MFQVCTDIGTSYVQAAALAATIILVIYPQPKTKQNTKQQGSQGYRSGNATAKGVH